MRFFIFIFLGILFTTCKVDSPLNCEDQHKYIPNEHENEVSPNKPFRNAPVRNPTNPAEFAYTGNDAGEPGIWTFNLITKTTTKVISFTVGSPPDWSTNDWLVFGDASDIFKCKSNGDSLAQLTFDNSNFYPRWSPDGKYIIYQKNEDDNIPNWSIIAENGAPVAEFKSDIYRGYAATWSPDGQKIAFVSTNAEDNRLAYFFLDSPADIHYLNTGNLIIRGMPLNWYSDSKNLLFTAANDIYKINIETEKFSVVKSNCPNVYFYHTLLADDSTIIANRTNNWYDPETNTIYYDWDLVKINSNGSEEVLSY